jgi:dipeptidyl aminopeptidase/acylaminoacyl peptidase
MQQDIKNKVFKYLIFLIIVALLKCITGTAVAKGEKSDPSIVQDLEILKNSNGKIVKQKKIRFKSKWSSRVDCYKIQYLSDGLKVVGYLLKPKIESSKFPVMIYNRGGNRDYGKITKENLPYLSYLAFNNYVVLASQYRGNDGAWRGQDEFGGKDVNDVMNLIPLAKSLPFADPNKIVMLGYSRGGMMTYLAIKHGADIKAAAVVGGVTDLFMGADEREEMKRLLKELIGTKREEWEKRSAYYWPEKINVPVLILHGEADSRVNVKQAQKLSKKLAEAGKLHKLVVFPQGNHGLGPPHAKRKNIMILNWFERYLQ